MNEEQNSKKPINCATISADQVSDYLTRNPGFFVDRPEVIEKISLKHQSGKAISLIEHQISRLRMKNCSLEKQLKQLLSNARENDRLYALTRRAINALLDTDDIGDLIDALHFQFDREFNIEFTRVLLFDESLAIGKAQAVTQEDTKTLLAEYCATNRPVCGQFSPEIRAFLFGTNAKDIASAAIAFLKPGGSSCGLLAIGSKNPHYYKTSTDTLFLTHLCDVLERQIHRLPRSTS